ncbi:MAG: SDR family NAD(P)-dependent oxidoreductase, partial [Calditrichaeota bacterium]|nr:SDR family NAD(P)-dependent oxidoreductase [Calditrichota bacterium]
MHQHLSGKIAIVTGSTKGIGKEIALEFAREGAKVVISGRNEERANEVVAEIKNAGGEALAVIGDVSVMADAQSLIDETVKAFGQVDILINNAGITRDNLF